MTHAEEFGKFMARFILTEPSARPATIMRRTEAESEIDSAGRHMPEFQGHAIPENKGLAERV